MSEALYKIESFFDTMPIRNILFLFANWIIFLSSSVWPELLIIIKISFFVILPRSPWEESLADRLKEGVPTEDNVAAIFEAIRPLFPTPHKITLDWHLEIWITALLNESLMFFLSVCKALISRLITSLAIEINFFFFH